MDILLLENTTINICTFFRIWLSYGLIIGSIIQWVPRFIRFINFELYEINQHSKFIRRKKRDYYE